MNKPRTLSQLLASETGGPLEKVLLRGKQLHRLSNYVLSHLDPDMQAHCRVLNLKDGVLHLGADNTAWATRLRYQSAMLLKLLHEDEKLQSIQQIHVRVIPATTPRQGPRRTVNRMSAQSADCVAQCAESIEDKRLSQALQQLSRRGMR